MRKDQFVKNWISRSSAVSGYPAIIDDGNTVAWFTNDEAYLVKDGANRVSQWTDKSGLDHHLLQATGTSQPLWSVNGLLFDGINDFMKCVGFTYEQPEMIYFVGRQVTWAANDTFFDGDLFERGVIKQITASPGIIARAGVDSPLNNNLILNIFSIIRVLFRGNASSLQINNSPIWNGNLGLNDMGNFTLGSGAIPTYWSNIQVKEVILRKSVDDAATQTLIYDYLKTQNGL